MKFSTILVLLLTIIAQGVGFFKEIAVATSFGAGSITDAYYIAILTPIIFVGILSSGIASIFIPHYKAIINEAGEDNANIFAINFSVFTSLIGILLFLLVNRFPELVMSMFAYGMVGDEKVLGVKFIVTSSFSMILLVNHIIFQGVLQVRNKQIFVVTANLVSAITWAFLVVYSVAPIDLVYAYLASVFVQSLILFSGANLWRLWRHISIKEVVTSSLIMRSSFVVIFGVLFNQSIFLIDRSFASTLSPGSVSIMNYAIRVSSLIEVIAVSGVLAIGYPRMADFALRAQKDKYLCFLREAFFLLSIFFVPMFIILITNSEDVVRLIFYRGEFSKDNVLNTANILRIYSFLVPLLAIKLLLIKVFHSYGMLSIVVTSTIFGFFVNLVGNILFIGPFKLEGLAFSAVLANIVTVFLFLLLGIKKNVIEFPGYFHFKSIVLLVVLFIFIFWVSGYLSDLLFSPHRYYRILFESIFSFILYCFFVILIVKYKIIDFGYKNGASIFF